METGERGGGGRVKGRQRGERGERTKGIRPNVTEIIIKILRDKNVIFKNLLWAVIAVRALSSTNISIFSLFHLV